MNKKLGFGLSILLLSLILGIFYAVIFRFVKTIMVSGMFPLLLICFIIGLVLVRSYRKETASGTTTDIDLRLLLKTYTVNVLIHFLIAAASISYVIYVASSPGSGLAGLVYGNFASIFLILLFLVLLIAGSISISRKRQSPKDGAILIYVALFLLYLCIAVTAMNFNGYISSYNRVSATLQSRDLVQQAIQGNDASYCFEIKSSSNPYESDDCFHKLAVSKKDPALCENIVMAKSRCYFNAAHATNNKSLCLKSTLDYERYDCLLSFVTSFDSIDQCSEVKDKEPFCKAIFSQDPKYCNDNSCYAYFAIQKNSTEYCNKLQGDLAVANCLNVLNSFFLADCEKVMVPTERIDCYINHIASTKDESLCNKIPYMIWWPYTTGYSEMWMQPAFYYADQCKATLNGSITR